MSNISAFGLSVAIVANRTFPAGFTVIDFADDADPLDLPDVTVGETSSGLNGELLVWGKPAPIPMTLAVIPGSNSDKNLAILLEANRVGRGKQSAKDVITATVVYPDGSTVILTAGAVISGPPGSGVASAGRLKTKTYTFNFENRAAT